MQVLWDRDQNNNAPNILINTILYYYQYTLILSYRGLGVLDGTGKEEKKCVKIEPEALKLSLFSVNTIIFLENQQGL